MSAERRNNNSNTSWSPARVALTIVVFGLLAAFGISSCSSGDESRKNPSEPPRVATNNPGSAPLRNAPPGPLTTLPPDVADAELKALSGDPIKLSSYSGKVLLVNLWATWCGPCRAETPELVKLNKEFRSQGVEIVGLSTEDPRSSEDLVREFVQRYNVDYRIGWSGPNVAIALMQGRDAIPQSFVFSRDGRVIKRFVGFNPYETPDMIRAAIEEALGKSAAD